MLKGLTKRCQVALLSRKDFLTVERDVGGVLRMIFGSVLRRISFNEPRSKGAAGGTGPGNQTSYQATISQGMLKAMITD